MYDAHAISLQFHRQAYVVFDHGELEESFLYRRLPETTCRCINQKYLYISETTKTVVFLLQKWGLRLYVVVELETLQLSVIATDIYKETLIDQYIYLFYFIKTGDIISSKLQ